MSTNSKPMVPVYFSRLIARELGLRENSLKALLVGTGITTRSFLEDDIKITTAQQTTVALNAMSITGDRGVGLRMGKLLSQGVYGPLGFLLNNSHNLKVALENYRTFLPDYVPFAHLVFREDDSGLTCIFEMRYAENQDLYRAAIESISLSLLSIARSIVADDELVGCQMYCRYRPPEYADRYSDYYKIPVFFGADDSFIKIPEPLLSVINPAASRKNYTLAETQCLKMAQQLSNEKTTTANRVKEEIISHMPGEITEEEVAKRLFVSRRTLSRRLALEGTSFRQLKGELYSTLAEEQLLATDESVESIALFLNYSDSSNFRRAFKKWFGTTPDEFRKNRD